MELCCVTIIPSLDQVVWGLLNPPYVAVAPYSHPSSVHRNFLIQTCERQVWFKSTSKIQLSEWHFVFFIHLADPIPVIQGNRSMSRFSLKKRSLFLKVSISACLTHQFMSLYIRIAPLFVFSNWMCKTLYHRLVCI